MDKNKLKEIAYKQQIDHLAQAQEQALKILIDQQQPFKLTVGGAMKYYHTVKARLGPEQFTEFIEIMRECREANIDCMVTVSKICSLFQNYPELLQGFGMFLPPSINLQVQTAGRFITKAETNKEFPLNIKTENNDKNESSANLLKSGVSIAENDSTMVDVQVIDSEKASTFPRKIDAKFAISYLRKVKERFKKEPVTFNKFLKLLECVRTGSLDIQEDIGTDVYKKIREMFKNNDDLIEDFKTFVPNSARKFELQAANVPNDKLESNFQNEDTIPFSDISKETLKYSTVNDPSIAAVGKYGSYEEHRFFDKLRKALCHREVYDNFLRCLILFTEDIVTRSELLNISTSFLGKFPDLLKEFKDILGFKESGDNIETVPMKIIKYENFRLDPEVALDIDYSTGGRNGASYRALPKDLKQPTCSGRTQLCKEVLNDTWVSFPSWSEDSTFVTSCKTEYEEMIYRCEDERFELDIAIRSNSYTIQALENVQKRINKMTPEEKSVFSLDDTLGGTSTVLHQKALHRCYGDKTDELVEGLKRNPVVAVPIILKRLRGKEEEWKEKQRYFNQIWREQIDHYYIKSLDHQGINFKQNDSKSFRSKSLLNEMEMVHAEKKENTVFHNSSPHFSLEFKEVPVFLDATNLICQYLKKLPGIFRDDRRRIELIVRNFIPDFFCFPRATILEESTADDEEEEEDQSADVMEIDNDNDERSGHTSPTGSAVLSKDEEFSDPEESNSVDENENEHESEESDKSFIEDSDIFDKLDTLQPTNLPYILFFVSKNWYVFFRQFHILCERLSRLLHESSRTDIPPNVKSEDIIDDEEIVDNKLSYSELILKLSQLLSGSIDYSQFEDEARSLFGIHAFVSFTMDKLILNIVRQLQQIVGDDICKQCTAFFYQHNKIIASGSYSSPLESIQVENQYLKKVERIMNEEKCFKILWHKKDQTLTIELIEHVVEKIDDPYEVEKWSNYLDTYVTEDSISEEILDDAPGLPVFLKRNLKHQIKFWECKVHHVENLWKKRHSPSYMKKNPPKFFCKRKSDLQMVSVPIKKIHLSKEKLDESVSVCSEMSTTVDSVNNSTLMELANPQSNESVYKVPDDSEKLEELVQSPEKCNETNEEKPDSDEVKTSFEIEAVVGPQELKTEPSEEPALNIKTEEGMSDNASDKVVYFCSSAETQTEENFILYDALLSAEKSESTQDSNEESICVKGLEENINSVAAFHDITEESIGNEIIDDIKSDSIEVVTIGDSSDEVAAVVNYPELVEKEKSPSPQLKDYEPRRRKARPVRKIEYNTRPRKTRSQQEYVKRRTRRTVVRSPKKTKNTQKQEEIDYATFDYSYFSELVEEDKIWYLVMKDFVVNDDTEGSFKRENFKLVFVQNCDTYLYRHNCLRRAKEIHQQVSEIKTSNFNAWHRVWLDRYVTPNMLKFCNDWLLKSDPEKFKVESVTMSDCMKPPYIPYNKYRVKYYKIDL